MVTTPEIKNDDGLLVYDDEGTSRCLGYLLSVGRGVYDAEFGKIDVTEEEAKKHNELFDRALLDGLKTCPVGQGAVFYVKNDEITTWLGKVLGKVVKKRNVYTFRWNEKVFQGKPAKGEEYCFFERIC